MKASLGSSPGELLKFGRSSWSESTVSRIITWKISYSSGVGWIFVEARRRRREVPLRVMAAVNWVGKAGRTADNCRCNTRFSGAASGQNLRYQWQKNGVKILGEASPSHLTSPTTLWGTGSPDRRSVSNSSGTTRSRFGIKDREVSADFLG